jgi:cell division protein FtsX
VTITTLYVILVICTCALLCVGIAMYVRVRRLARASETQFRQALKDAAKTGAEHEHRAEAAPTEVAR